MLYLNPNIYSKDFVIKLQRKVEEDMLAGAVIIEFISEGTQFKGVQAVTFIDMINAIDMYWDEINGNLITETQPNFSSNPILIQGQTF